MMRKRKLKEFAGSIRRNKMAMTGTIILSIFILVAIFGPIIVPFSTLDFGDAEEHVTWCTYGRSRFVAAYERGPLFATQFHPEKSAEAGAQLLRNWVATF